MRLTPINIVSACLIAWFFIEDFSDKKPLLTITGLLTMLLLLLFVDIFFRISIKKDKKLWLYEVAFVLLVSFLTIIIKLV